MNCLYVLRPDNLSIPFETKLNRILHNYNTLTFNEKSTLPDLRNKKILFIIEADESGFCVPIYKLMNELHLRGNNSLDGSTGSVIVISHNELYTKSLSRNIIFLANQLGCSFIGHPVVEAIRDFVNFNTWKKTLNLPLEEIFILQCSKLVKRLIDDHHSYKNIPQITVVHSSQNATSNTLKLWNMIKSSLSNCITSEFKIENGEILDCKGCTFKSCLYYSKQKGCFYGGIMTDQIYPSIENCDALVLICPNYNDALSANLTAFINRLTALYRRISFYDKVIYAVIVSGNSGSDLVAMQIIDALNVNKGFRLPPYFAVMEIAYEPGAIEKIPCISDKSSSFADNIVKNLVDPSK